MPLHPSLVLGPLALGLIIVAFELHFWRRPSMEGRRLLLGLHIAWLASAIAAAASGSAEAARVQAAGPALELMSRHDMLGTGCSFGIGFLLLLRLGTWRAAPSRVLAAVLAGGTVTLALGLLTTARLGGTLVFRHGVGVTAPPPALPPSVRASPSE